ncbi:MAG: hypothetical protein QOE36_3498 [Gaiellaceae bacterium]|nr:hypothetical protein [Gaiellaceae bacterium]
MRILVLGGTRFIGPFLVRELVAAGHEVAIFHRGEHEVELPVEHMHGDFADFDRRLHELRAFEPETVVDMLAVRAEDAARVAGFAGVADRAVVVSSSDVYRAFARVWRTEPGPPDPVPLTEESPLRANVIDPEYDKLGVEAALREVDLPVAVLRMTGVHGPGDYQHRLWTYVKRIDDGRPAILLAAEVESWRRARVYVENAAHAIAVAAVDQRAAGDTFNVADETALTEAEWISEIASATGWSGRIVIAPSPALPVYLQEGDFDFSQDYVLDTSRIRERLGYREIVSANDGLRRTIAWERANPAGPGYPHPEHLDHFDYDAEDDALARLGSGS